MHITAVLAAWLVLVAVLTASGVGKLRHPDDAAEAAVSLRVPTRVRASWLLRAHPWAELLLAVALLVLPHPASVVAAAAALVLILGYLVLVARVVASGTPATCHCFGSLGSGTVDGWTLTRNTMLAALGAVVLIDAGLGESAVSRLSALGEGDRAQGWWWLLAVGLAAAVTYLVVRPGRSSAAVLPGADVPADLPALRLPVPDVPVLPATGSTPVSLRAVAPGRPHLLLLLSPGCGPCRMIGNRLATWAREVPGTDFVVTHPIDLAEVRRTLPEWEPFFVQDHEGAVADALDDPARPWAVLIDAEGRIDSAPAQGYTAITALVDRLRTGESPTVAGSR